MTATISADVTLSRVWDSLAEFEQWLPIDGEGNATVGELIDRNSTGALRLGYGAWRDLLLGAQFINGRGELITAGGRTVKNVAGYDLTKFMVGQRGAFGQLVTITTRTYRLPAAALWAQFAPDEGIVNRLMPTSLRPQWMLMNAGQLLCGYLGDAQTIDYYANNLTQHRPAIIARHTLAEDISRRAALWRIGSLRAAVPPSKTRRFADQADATNWIADAAFGIVRLFDPIDISQACAAAIAVGGSAFRETEMTRLAELYDRASQDLLMRLKNAFDPSRKLNRLEFA
jgi:hypothetical protein